MVTGREELHRLDTITGPPPVLPTTSVLVVGKESVGKSQLITSLTGKNGHPANYRGSTLACETFDHDGRRFIDTPGLYLGSDSETTRESLSRLERSDDVLLVVQATRLDDDLEDLLPLVDGSARRVSAVVTFFDKIGAQDEARVRLRRIAEEIGIPMMAVDARNLTDTDRAGIFSGIRDAGPVRCGKPTARAGWRIEPQRSPIEWPFMGPMMGILLLLLPAMCAVWGANTFAARVDASIQDWVGPLAASARTLPSALAVVIAGDFGLITMCPLLFVWALPTVVLFGFFLGVYKITGLLDRISVALHPLTWRFGISGRGLVYVIMGYGCNVPAVVSTRACSACSRETAISAVTFGSACSYQLGATISVFVAFGAPGLVIPYILFLTATMLIYVRLTSPAAARCEDTLLGRRRVFLQRPRLEALWREVRGILVQFLTKATPIFLLVTIAASLLDWSGVLDRLVVLVEPVMAVFNLPREAATPIVLSSIRKDGILLFAGRRSMDLMTTGQLLTGVYLAGVLLPCLVTLLAIARERSIQCAVFLMVRQAVGACVFAAILAWAWKAAASL